MNLVWGKMGRENLTAEEPLPAGGIHDHPGGKTLQSAASPEVPVTVSLECLYLSIPLFSCTACRKQVNVLAFGWLLGTII